MEDDMEEYDFPAGSHAEAVHKAMQARYALLEGAERRDPVVAETPGDVVTTALQHADNTIENRTDVLANQPPLVTGHPSEQT